MVALGPHAFSNPTDAALLEAQGNQCFYCGGFLSSWDATRDHLFPRLGGKGDALDYNKVMACKRCNAQKGHRPPTPDEVKRARENFARCGLPRFAFIGKD